jgi:hypothetical protein
VKSPPKADQAMLKESKPEQKYLHNGKKMIAPGILFVTFTFKINDHEEIIQLLRFDIYALFKIKRAGYCVHQPGHER